MKTTKMLLMFLACLPIPVFALDTARIEQVTGLKGTLDQQGNVYKVSVPRGDLGITVDGWKMPAFMGLTTWAAFTDGKEEEAMVMGDFVLLQDEVNPVMSTLLESGLSVTALHNHFFNDDPKAWFMHISGENTAEQLAKGVRAALDNLRFGSSHDEEVGNRRSTRTNAESQEVMTSGILTQRRGRSRLKSLFISVHPRLAAVPSSSLGLTLVRMWR